MKNMFQRSMIHTVQRKEAGWRLSSWRSIRQHIPRILGEASSDESIGIVGRSRELRGFQILSCRLERSGQVAGRAIAAERA